MTILAAGQPGRTDPNLAARGRLIVDRTRTAWEIPSTLPHRAAKEALYLSRLGRWRAAASAKLQGAAVIAHSW